MKKLLLAIFVFVYAAGFSQKMEDKIWDLLLNNKRTEARSLFDKNLASKKTTNFEFLLLDAMIDEEMGEFNFDETFLKNYLALNEDANYLFAMSKHRFILGDESDYGFDELSYRKIDLLAESPKFQNENFVLSYKAALDRNRKNYAAVEKEVAKMGQVNKWQRAGVFENLNGSGLDIEYEPEQYAKSDKAFNANSLGMVNWYNPKWKLVDGFEYLTNEKEYGEGIVYAQSFIQNPTERRVLLETNINTEYKVFLNDVEILSTTREGYTNPGSHLVEVLLPQGMNRLLLKLELKNDFTAYMAVFYDKDYHKISDLTYFDTFQEYKKSALAQLNPMEQPLRFENMLKGKIAAHPNKTYFKLLLASGYLSNEQYEQSREVVEDLLKKYPNSTMLKVMLTQYYAKSGDGAKSNEVLNSVQVHDPMYYLVPLMSMREDGWVHEASIAEIEEKAQILRKTKAHYFADLFLAIAAAKKRDIPTMVSLVKSFRANMHNNETFFTIVAPMENLDQVDNTKLIASFEDFLSKRINISAMLYLSDLYKGSNRTEDLRKLYQEYIGVYPSMNNFRKGKAVLMLDQLQNPEVMQELDEALANFPYSFTVMAAKADVFAKQNKKEDALKFAAKSLSHYSGNTELLELQKHLGEKEDEISVAAITDFKKLIKERRNTKLKGEKGITTLLDEYIVNVFPEGGYKSRSSYLLEVTSKTGIDELKEYYVGDGRSILKAEMYKANGTIVPAEKSNGQIVFTNIDVGDVALIQTEWMDGGSGRFYKDFHLTSYFNSTYPVVESVFTVITPQDTKLQTASYNGEIPSTTKRINGKVFQTWKKEMMNELTLNENYSPSYNDLATSMTVNSIGSWAVIADWYADLIKKNMVTDNTTNKAFNEIFPTAFSGMTDYQKAEKIYEYIQKNINYSSVDFRQSGYIPQKPSKTLVTKLGDCKDLSALFLVLGKQAGIKSNMVLVQTKNYADSNLLLPNMSFNHCIVQTFLDGKPYYIEMTDKHLPFNAKVKTLYNAKALVVNADKSLNADSQIFEIPTSNHITNIYKTETEVDFRKNDPNYKTKQSLNGESKAFFNEFFTDEKTEQEKKKYFEETYGGVLNSVAKVSAVNLISNKDLGPKPIAYSVDFTLNEIPQSVGNMKIVKIPFVTTPFTKEIVATENRSNNLKYVMYESQDQYDEQITMLLPENAHFIEVPKPEQFSFNGFRYGIDYQLEAPNKLVIRRTATTPWDDISQKDYPQFKSFVEKILKIENQVLAYKQQ